MQKELTQTNPDTGLQKRQTWSEPTESFLRKVSSRAEQPVAWVESAVTGYRNQIRHAPQEVIAGQIMAAISLLAKNYGARADIEPEMVKEAVRLVMTQFSHLGVDELKDAYRLWASGQIDAGKGSEMYAGQFSAGQLGKVLGAYCEHRKKIIAAYTNLLDQEREEQEEEARVARMKSQYMSRFRENISRFCESGKGWQDVPAHWYQMLTKLGDLNPTEAEIKQLTEDAAELAEMELRAEIEEEANPFKRVNLERIFQAGGIEARAMVIYEKMAVFRLYVLPRRNETK